MEGLLLGVQKFGSTVGEDNQGQIPVHELLLPSVMPCPVTLADHMDGILSNPLRRTCGRIME
jgi:hypothetical protein